MDPLSALNAAAAIVQFIDFTKTLVTSTYKIHKSGQEHEKENIDLKTITTSFNGVNHDLRSSLARLGANKQLSKHEQDINHLCDECTKVADQLLSVLNSLKARYDTNIWGSFQLALKAIWSQKDIVTLQRRLDSFRQQISVLILISLKEQNETVLDRQAGNDQLYIEALHSTQDITRKLLTHMDQTNIWQAKVIDVMRKDRHGKSVSLDGELSSLNLQAQVYQDYLENFEKEVLSRLHYGEMQNRYERIASIHSETFEWIFKPYGSQLWSDFVEFLQGDENLYWITGKPGAGKSTLMKYLSDDPKTKAHLSAWACDKELIISGFFFWSSGTQIQMSLEGLLRALLYDTLRQRRDLIRMIFTSRWEAYVVFGDIVAWDQPFSLLELLRAFKVLIQEASKSTKLVFLIDGLDEYHGTHAEQLKLVNLIQTLSSPDVKFCVSSRPWNVFEEGFKSRPSLRLEDITYGDIKKYVTSKLYENEGFLARQQMDPDSASLLIDNVTSKASGVFLWVTLVVESILEGLTDGELLSELQKRLDSLPADLEELFWKILHSVDFERASQQLQIVRLANESFSLLDLFFANEEEESLINLPVAPLTEQQLSARAMIMKRRLNACCKGLLEVERHIEANGSQPVLYDAHIGYLHRTVKDFVHRSDVWTKLLASTNSTFNPAVRMCLSDLASIKILSPKDVTNPPSVKSLFQPGFWRQVMVIIRHIIHAPGIGPEQENRLLEELDHTVAKLVMMNGWIDGIYVTQRSAITKSKWFIHLAVQAKLVKYVSTTLDDLAPEDAAEINPSVFDLAMKVGVRCGPDDPRWGSVSLYTWDAQEVPMEDAEPSLELIRLLLKRGADPGADTDITYKNNAGTLWGFALEESKTNSALLKVLLEHRASPFLPQLNSEDIAPEIQELARMKGEEILRTKKKNAEVKAAAQRVSRLSNRFSLSWFHGRSHGKAS